MKSAVADALSSLGECSNLTVKSRFRSLTIEEKTSIEEEIVLESRSETMYGLNIVERYSEREINGNNRLWRAWILMRVPQFDNGAARFSIISRSIALPGWGQFYRGSKTKGFIFSIGEIASISGAIFAAVRQNDFEKKAASSIYQSHRDYYYDQADEYHQSNVICVSAAVGLYTLNLADAIFSSSNKADIYYSTFRIEPTLDNDFKLTICLTYNY
jgi:hypothetical protein